MVRVEAKEHFENLAPVIGYPRCGLPVRQLAFLCHHRHPAIFSRSTYLFSVIVVIISGLPFTVVRLHATHCFGDEKMQRFYIT